MKYEYVVKPKNDPYAFIEACKEIENYDEKITKEPLLIDVDGTTIQIFQIDGKEIIVIDDYDVGAVSIESDIELILPQYRKI